MFEITPDDIALLDDEQLRAVVARLCEAELRQRGISPAYVTWGGNQNAADGGLDVRVDLPAGTLVGGFIPRAATGFQVKRQDVPAGKIQSEMRPKAQKGLRRSIQSLADQSGAYIIVSSQGSTTDSSLNERHQAMCAAMLGEPNANQIFFRFYDRSRIATWVRSHEGLIPYVRDLVGKPIPGWQSYGSWAYAPEPPTAHYLEDEKLRIHTSRGELSAGLSPLEGIRVLRDKLRLPQTVVRLTGVSGVGKTRLVQALFDDRLGFASLDPAVAIYTDTADSPDPQPTALASNLVASRTRAILVIDNCAPELHRRLSEVCRQPQSNVSLITIEYDIREDRPEGTEVFRLETSSPEFIEKLLALRVPSLSQVNAHTIARFSGGNARIALALAGRIEQDETVSGLTDRQLRQRLFVERDSPDRSLYQAAQACSLVYSFDGEDLSTGNHAEMIQLSLLIGSTPQELYRHVANLFALGLVQKRAAWRAVLPQAVADGLAAEALEAIPYAYIQQHLLRPGSSRMMTSFTRRLGYLHASNQAVRIVTQWLGPGGLLVDFARLDDLGRRMFENVAPAAPEAVLIALERGCSTQPTACVHFCDLVRLLAFEPHYFQRCIEILVLILRNEDARSNRREVFASLFQISYSGTHASIEERLKVLDALLSSPDDKRRALGVLGLRAVLKTAYFSIREFDFGAHPRDFGYWPRNLDDIRNWFSAALRLVEKFDTADTPVMEQTRAALAEQFRGLWNEGGVQDELVSLCQKINANHFWPAGWVAVRRTLRVEAIAMPEDCLAKLVNIERDLRPTGLSQEIRSIVLTQHHLTDLDEYDQDINVEISSPKRHTEEMARDLGAAAAADAATLDELLPELVSNNGHLWPFGEGLHSGASDPAELWARLVGALAATKEGLGNPEVLRGFLNGLHTKDATLAGALLDESFESAILAPWYPWLQVAVPITEKCVARLKRSLALGKTPVQTFRALANCRVSDLIPAADLQEILLTIAGMTYGYDVAVDILQMRLHSYEGQKQDVPPELIAISCELLRRFVFASNGSDDYQIGAIAKFCLLGKHGEAIAQDLCIRLKAAVTKHATQAFNHNDLLDGLFSAQPRAALEGLCGGETTDLESGIDVLRHVGSDKQVIAAVPEEDLLHWCEKQGQTRFVAMAQVITSFTTTQSELPKWTRLGIRFLERAPDPDLVLQQFTAQFMPRSGWTGSRAAIVEANSALLDQLDAFPALQQTIHHEKQRLALWVADERERESGRDRQLYERFE